MRPHTKHKKPHPADWDLEISQRGELLIDGCSALELAAQYGTPLHVVQEKRLAKTAGQFLDAFSQAYPGRVSAHYAFKCNPVAGVVHVLQQSGFKAEIMSRFELELALRLGFKGKDIIVNGPYKPEHFLAACLKNKVRFIIADSLSELSVVDRVAARLGEKATLLLRINPDHTPKGMNSGTATGSRKGCAFGLDLKSGEPGLALKKLQECPHIQWAGFHFHMGTGIRQAEDYYRAIAKLKPLLEEVEKLGLKTEVLDIGGGFATPHSREMTTLEMLYYQATNRLPGNFKMPQLANMASFAERITAGIYSLFGSDSLPELILEPGRCLTSSNQLLLLAVEQVKDRPGIGKWITTNGGIGTVAMPVFYEYHEVFLCNEPNRPLSGPMTINGPGCFAADVVYRNKRMPHVQAGEILAIMDSGAYFTSWESNFGYPRPAVIAASGGKSRILRRRETYDEMMIRDFPNSLKESSLAEE